MDTDVSGDFDAGDNFDSADSFSGSSESSFDSFRETSDFDSGVGGLETYDSSDTSSSDAKSANTYFDEIDTGQGNRSAAFDFASEENDMSAMRESTSNADADRFPPARLEPDESDADAKPAAGVVTESDSAQDAGNKANNSDLNGDGIAEMGAGSTSKSETESVDESLTGDAQDITNEAAKLVNDRVDVDLEADGDANQHVEPASESKNNIESEDTDSGLNGDGVTETGIGEEPLSVTDHDKGLSGDGNAQGIEALPENSDPEAGSDDALFGDGDAASESNTPDEKSNPQSETNPNVDTENQELADGIQNEDFYARKKTSDDEIENITKPTQPDESVPTSVDQALQAEESATEDADTKTPEADDTAEQNVQANAGQVAPIPSVNDLDTASDSVAAAPVEKFDEVQPTQTSGDQTVVVTEPDAVDKTDEVLQYTLPIVMDPPISKTVPVTDIDAEGEELINESDSSIDGQLRLAVRGIDDIEAIVARPSGFRSGIRDEVFERAKDPDGFVRDPLTKEIIDPDQPWDMGHEPGYEFRKHQVSAIERNISRDEFLDEHNNPNHYRPELPSSNRSHKDELLDVIYFGS